MKDKTNTIFTVILLSVIPTLLIWSPFFFRLTSFWKIPLPPNGMGTIVANYDGPLYIIVAKTLYNPEAIKAISSFPLTTQYYTAHFPLYPLLIKLSKYQILYILSIFLMFYF